MLRNKSILILVLAMAFVWACTEDSHNPTEATQEEVNNEFNEKLAKGNPYAEFKVELTNLTPATGPGASQPFSPPVIATHTPFFHLYRLFGFASDEIRYIAEDAVNAPMITKLSNSKYVYDHAEGSEGPVFPQTTQEFILKTKLPFTRLSLVAMLVNTNDAFVAVNGARLPLRGSREYYLKAYDAGTEKNTELASDIPGPCCGNGMVRVPTRERIKFHKGIIGTGDLDPSVYDWDKMVAKIKITRIN